MRKQILSVLYSVSLLLLASCVNTNNEGDNTAVLIEPVSEVDSVAVTEVVYESWSKKYVPTNGLEGSLILNCSNGKLNFVLDVFNPNSYNMRKEDQTAAYNAETKTAIFDINPGEMVMKVEVGDGYVDISYPIFDIAWYGNGVNPAGRYNEVK